MRSGSKPMIILLVFYVLALLFAAVLAVFTFPGDQVHESFTLTYLLAASVSNLFYYLFAFHGAGILLAFSLFISRSDLKPKSASLISGSRGTVLLLILTGLIYALGATWFIPASNRATSDFRYHTELADELRGDAALFEESRQYSRALAALEGYVALVGESDEITRRMDNLESRISEEELARTPRVEDEGRRFLRSELRELSPAELVVQARSFMEEEDYYSAHYYADLAWRMSDGLRPDARRLASEAWEEISTLALSRMEEEQSDYFQRKRDAYRAFQGGQSSPESLIDAYYLFLDLQRERPEDPDLENYLSLSRQQLREVSFFLEDAEAVRANPGAREILGVNDRSATEWEVFRVGKLVRDGEDHYFYDLEVVRFDEAGTVLFHFQAPYAKMIGSVLNMQAISRDSAEVRELPRVITGELPGELGYMYEISYTTTELATAGSGVDRREEANIVELFALRNLAADLALPQEPLEAELVGRVAEPVVFISLSLLFLGIGYGMRSRYVGRVPAPAMLFLPLLPVISHIVFVLLGYVVSVLSASLLLFLSWTATVLVLGSLLFLFLCIALFSVVRTSVG
ncbi:MAG: hypothetical protein ACOC28_02605 [Alkalispirochaetaceae bacterium]